MDRAASAFVGVFRGLVPDKNTPIIILCGTGNNGGDGLAISLLLQCDGYNDINIVIIPTGHRQSDDFAYNMQRVKERQISIHQLERTSLQDFDGLGLRLTESVLIDSILGVGINRPLDRALAEIIKMINQQCKRVVAVDLPTGFRCEGELDDDGTVLYAHEVISFQRPKLNFFFPESAKYMENFHVVDIGLREAFLAELPSDYYLIDSADIEEIYNKRKSFSHKGNYGHALIYAGSAGKVGAALIATEACLRTGVGLATVCLPEEERHALYARLPEAMLGSSEELFEGVKYSAIAFGPGLGRRASFLSDLFKKANAPLIIDADGLNYLSKEDTLLNALPADTVLTPHMKEFDRLFGPSENWWQRLQLARRNAQKFKITIVLKNRYTFIITEKEEVLINPTGNPAMAIAGMGDALTGMLTSFIAQGYSPREACILGCFLHGRAGDRLRLEGHAVVLPTVLLTQIPLLLGELKNVSFA